MANHWQVSMNNMLISKGIPMKCGRVVNTSGHCWYDTCLAHCENDSFRKTVSKKASNIHDVSTFREDIAKFMGTNRNLHKLEAFKNCKISVLSAPDNANHTWKTYLTAVATTNKYADELVVLCTAIYFRKNILIASDHPSNAFMKNWEFVPGQPEGWSTPVQGAPFIIGHIDLTHYEALTELQPDSGEKSCYACGMILNDTLQHLKTSNKNCNLFYDMNAFEDSIAMEVDQMETSENMEKMDIDLEDLKRRDRKKQKNKEYYLKNKSTINEKARKYKQENRKSILEKHRKYNHDNRDSIVEKQTYYNDKNRVSIAEKQKEYDHKNRDSILKKRKEHDDKHKEETKTSRRYKIENETAEQRFRNMYKDLQNTWASACISCHRIMSNVNCKNIKEILMRQ